MAMIDEMPDDAARESVRKAGLEMLTTLVSDPPLPPQVVATLLVLAATATRCNPRVSERTAGFVCLAAIIADSPHREEIAHIIRDIA